MSVLKCPNCNANLEIVESSQFASCKYCGTKVLISSNTINFTTNQNIQIIQSKSSESESRISEFQKIPNVKIIYRSVHDNIFKLRITLDGRNWKILNKDDILAMYLPQGKHKIVFCGKKTYTYVLVINDTNKSFIITYFADKHRNTIEQTIIN